MSMETNSGFGASSGPTADPRALAEELVAAARGPHSLDPDAAGWAEAVARVAALLARAAPQAAEEVEVVARELAALTRVRHDHDGAPCVDSDEVLALAARLRALPAAGAAKECAACAALENLRRKYSVRIDCECLRAPASSVSVTCGISGDIHGVGPTLAAALAAASMPREGT